MLAPAAAAGPSVYYHSHTHTHCYSEQLNQLFESVPVALSFSSTQCPTDQNVPPTHRPTHDNLTINSRLFDIFNTADWIRIKK
jgi:hypothetical protein